MNSVVYSINTVVPYGPIKPEPPGPAVARKSCMKASVVFLVLTLIETTVFARPSAPPIEATIRQIIANKLHIAVEKVTDKKSLKALGADNVDATLILTELQYELNFDFDQISADELEKPSTKVSELIQAANKAIYP